MNPIVELVTRTGEPLATGEAFRDAGLVMLVVFAVMFIMYALISIASRIIAALSKNGSKASPAQATASPAQEAAEDFSSGRLKLTNCSEKNAAIIMAIVSDNTGIPLSELVFKSITLVEKK